MKSLSTIVKTSALTAVLGALLLVSCGSRDAKQVAQSFLQAYYIEHDFDAAKKLATDNSQENLQHRAVMFGLMSEVENFTSFEILKMDMQKTKAVCHYKVDETERRLLLSKADGQWKVDMPQNVEEEGDIYSLSTAKPESGGFASTESEQVNLNDLPKSKN